ncbi:MAG: hypothetical protein ACR2OO_14925 [Thermomicrobiales bacterium]
MDNDTHDSLAFLAESRPSRRALLKGAGIFGAGLTLAQLGLSRPAAAAATKTEKVQDILDILATNEAFGVTLVGTVLDSAKHGTFSTPIPDMVLKILTGVRAEEQFHLDFLQGAGAKLLTDTFHIPEAKMLTDPKSLFKDLVDLEDAAIAAVMASLPTFARERRIDLLKANFQFATEEAEHRLLANHALGTRPANDHAFAPTMFTSVAEFLALLKKKGIIGGSGMTITYPGPGEPVDPTGVIYHTPGGPLVNCLPTGTPSA